MLKPLSTHMQSFIYFLFFSFTLIIPFHAFANDIQTTINNSIWNPLSDIEIETLSHTQLAQDGDADALLSLAILASGDIRNRADYNKIKTKVHHFVNQLKPALSNEKDTWIKGQTLFLAMHNEFFLSNNNNNIPQGYQLDQSQFSQIFRNKTYNCISSTILYLVLARYFDLQVEGVILPSHSFVQLTTPSGNVIEIETTSITGYGLLHSREFYEKNASRWYQSRNLPLMTYDDYLRRDIVSIYQLITENMNHQHTMAERLNKVDRNRLYELRAWLSPDNKQAQLYRLYVFNNELNRLKENDDNTGTFELINIAEAIIKKNYDDSLANNSIFDSETHQIISHIYTRKAELLLKNNDYTSAVHELKIALKWVQDTKQEKNIQRNISVSWLNYGNTFFSKTDYTSAIKYYSKAYSKSIDNDLREKIDNNIASAYWNLSVPLLNKGNSYEAFNLLDECRTKHPHIKQCQQKIDSICQSYSLPACSK